MGVGNQNTRKSHQALCMAKILAFFNQAGGVGKTTLVMNLGYQLAKRKSRVLLVDMDPQSSLTLFMGLDPREVPFSVHEALVSGSKLPVNIDIHRMSIAPTNPQTDEFEEQLLSSRDYAVLRRALEPLANDYDYVLIDCPPSKNVNSKIAMAAADYIVIPVTTEFKGLAGTDQVLETIAKVKTKLNEGLSILAIIPTMFDGRTRQHRLSLEDLEAGLSTVAPISPPIPKSIAFADASSLQIPFAQYDPQHQAVDVLDTIATFLVEATYESSEFEESKAV